MLDLLSIGTNRGHSMIGVGISAGLSGAKRARSIQDPLPALDLDWATDRSLPAAYGPTPSFSRASTGTFFNSSGVLTTAAINAPRFNHVYNGSSWVSKGLLVEEQRTNDLTYSRDFANAAWLKLQALDTVTANAADGPFGTLSATKLTPSTTSAFHGLSRGTVSFSGNRAASVYAKSGGYDFIGLEIKDNFRAVISLSDGTVSSNTLSSSSISTVNVGNGWWRITYFYSSTVDRLVLYPLPTSTFGSFAGNGTSGIHIDQAQIETGLFPTSAIPTTTAAVTRSADVCQITGADLTSILSFTEGSFAVEFDSLVSNTGALGYGIFAISDSATNLSRMFFDFYIPDNAYRWYIRDDGNSGKTTQLKPGPLSDQGVSVKSSMAYKQNDIAISLNSASALTGIDQTIPATLNRLQIGTNDAYSGRVWCGHIARLRYYSTRLTNAKLQELST